VNSTFGRLLIWGVVVGVLCVLASVFDVDELDEPRRPLPPTERGRAWLDKEPATPPAGRTPQEPTMDVIVEDGELGGEDVIGTAFLVGPNLWVTAAHVLADCKAGYIRIQGRWRRVTEMRLHQAADVAILRTAAEETPPVLALTDRAPVLDQDGFHVGYPHGTPATVYTRFIGLTRIRGGKPGTPIEQGWVWAEIRRVPDTVMGLLGGLSGGPQVDRTGAVQGVTILHSERSGRLTTAPMRRVREIVPSGVEHSVLGGGNIGPDDFARHGEQARRSGAVSLVFCSASGSTRPR
jgi:serine protease Do